jgi:hypothetical protein
MQAAAVAAIIKPVDRAMFIPRMVVPFSGTALRRIQRVQASGSGHGEQHSPPQDSVAGVVRSSQRMAKRRNAQQ